MKPSGFSAATFLALLLVLLPAPLAAISAFDVIRLSKERYADEEILRLIQTTDSRFVLSAQDTARLRQEGVTEAVIREMLSRPAQERRGESPSPEGAAKPSRPSDFLRTSGDDVRGDSPAPRSPSSGSASLLEDLVRMTNGGFSDETILAYAKAHRAELPSVVGTDDLLRLRESGVSETVIRYMAAIDVRASDEGSAEDVAYDSDEAAGSPAGSGSYSDSYPESDPYSYPDSYANSYYAGYDPFYGDIGYPYPVYFFVDHGGFFRRFHRRGHSFAGRRGGVIGHGRPGRPRFPHEGFGSGFRERSGRVVVRHGGPGRPASPRGAFGPGLRAPRGGVMARGGFGQPGSPRGAPVGGGVGRGPISRPGGGRGAMARPGGNGRR